MSKQKIVSIEIELKDYEPIKFTMDEARELHEQLDALFGQKEVVHKHYNDYWWNRPYYTWTNGAICETKWEAGTGNTTTSAVALLANDSVTSQNTGMKVSYQS